ncbi:hypothetical protein [Sphingobium sp. DN12]|uniref:hypothetical protein n=1 Tax=Sphingobium sp. DN12 TaxID=3378073 RepID=UPI003DA39432
MLTKSYDDRMDMGWATARNPMSGGLILQQHPKAGETLMPAEFLVAIALCIGAVFFIDHMARLEKGGWLRHRGGLSLRSGPRRD